MPIYQKNLSYAYGLDAIRFLCSVMVCVFHLTWHNSEMVKTAPFGWIGVQIFFVISGVVIAGSAVNATTAQFIKRRFLRLYPAAWIAAAINFGLLLCVPRTIYDDLGIWVVPTVPALLHSLALLGTTFLASAYWTLPIELSFYGLVLLSVYGGGVERLKYVGQFLIVVGAPYLILLFFSNIGIFNTPWLDLGYGPRNMLLLRHGVYFSIGIYFWLITSGQTFKSIDKFLLVIAMIAALLEIYVRGAQTIGNYATAAQVQLTLSHLVTWAIAIFAFLTGCIFLSIRHATMWVPLPVVANCLRTLGLATYPFYLIHEVVGGFVLSRALAQGFSYQTGVVAAVSVVVTAACLIALYAEPWLRRTVGKTAFLAQKIKSA